MGVCGSIGCDFFDHRSAFIPGLLQSLHLLFAQVFLAGAPEVMDKGKARHFCPLLHQVHNVAVDTRFLEGTISGQECGIGLINYNDVHAGDVLEMFAATGCDGVMIARGGLGNPWIFREAVEIMEGREPADPTPSERAAMALRHFQFFADLSGERVALREMRKHLAWYAKGLSNASRFRDMINRIDGKEELIQAMESFFHRSAA